MTDVTQMMQRQADWQKTRVHLSWPEKMKQAEILRDASLKWCAKRNTTKPASRDGQS
jgi:hypothetical protein